MAVDKPLPNRRLLIVDSDLSIARQSAKKAESLGWETYTANRSARALEIYLHKLPALILVEMLLPDGNGLDLIREIRTYDWSHASRVYIHSFVRGSVEVVTADAKLAGANGLLAKPFSTRKLDELVPLPEASAEQSGLPFDAPASDSAETLLAMAETQLDPRQVSLTDDVGGPAGDADTGADSAERTANGILDGELDLSLDEMELGDDTELDAWLEDLTGQSESDETQDSTRAVPDWPDAVRELEQRRSTWTPTDGSLVTLEGQLASDTLLHIVAAAWREIWFGRILVESGRSWTELSTGEGLLWTVTCDDTGPSVVDVGFRHGLLAARDLGKLSEALRQRGERSARAVLAAAGVSEDGIQRTLELTAVERVMAAFESGQGSYRCRSNLPPTSRTFEARIPLGQIVSLAVDRHVPVMRAVDRYTGREQEVLRKTNRFEPFLRHVLSDRLSRDAIANFKSGETLLDWLQKNPSNPGALFLLLTKLEEVGAVTLGRTDQEPPFTFGQTDGVVDNDHTAVTIPATPKQTSRRLAEISDVPAFHSSPQPDQDSTAVESAGPAVVVEDEPIVEDDVDGEASPSPQEVEIEGSTEPEGLEGAGFAASLRQLRISGEQAVVADDVEDDPQPVWQADLFRLLDRWDHRAARDELQARLIEAPEDAKAAAFEAWLAFARAIEGDNGGFDPGHALNELEHVLEAAPSAATPYLLLGFAAISLGNNKQALAHFDRGLEVNPSDDLLNASAVLVRAGFYEHPEADRSPGGIWRLVRRVCR